MEGLGRAVELARTHRVEQHLVEAERGGAARAGHEGRVVVEGDVQRAAHRLRLAEREGDPVAAHVAAQKELRLHQREEGRALDAERATGRRRAARRAQRPEELGDAEPKLEGIVLDGDASTSALIPVVKAAAAAAAADGETKYCKELRVFPCMNHLGKPSDQVARYTNQLRAISPSHPWVVRFNDLDASFERCATQFSTAAA